MDPLRLLAGVVVGLGLFVGGVGSAVWAYDDAGDCERRYGDDPDVHADCWDFLALAVLVGGGAVGLLGAGLLATVGLSGYGNRATG